jgi:adenylate cyclase
LVTFVDALAANTRYMLGVMAQHHRKGEFLRRVRDLSASEFAQVLEQTTAEFTQLAQALEISNSNVFESTLDQMIEGFTLKVGQILNADRASLFLLDEGTEELWSKVAQGNAGDRLELRVPLRAGIVGQVAASGLPRNIAEVYADPLFHADVDRQTGYRTWSMLCFPMEDSKKRVFAVVQLLNKNGGEPFDAADEHRLREFAGSMGIVLESWWLMSQRAQLVVSRGLSQLPGHVSV